MSTNDTNAPLFEQGASKVEIERHPTPLIRKALAALEQYTSHVTGDLTLINEARDLLVGALLEESVVGITWMHPQLQKCTSEQLLGKEGGVLLSTLLAILEILGDVTPAQDQRRLGEAIDALRNGRLSGHAVVLVLSSDTLLKVKVPYYGYSAGSIEPEHRPAHGVIRYIGLEVVVEGWFDFARLPHLYRLTRSAQLDLCGMGCESPGTNDLPMLPERFVYSQESETWVPNPTFREQGQE